VWGSCVNCVWVNPSPNWDKCWSSGTNNCNADPECHGKYVGVVCDSNSVEIGYCAGWCGWTPKAGTCYKSDYYLCNANGCWRIVLNDCGADDACNGKNPGDSCGTGHYCTDDCLCK
jgi:hypothetical protein